MPKPLVIDLSHHNVVKRDLNNTRAAGIAGVIHKATDGTKFVDEKVRARYSLAKDSGLLFGLYHFLRPGYIKQQADHFLSSPIWDSSTLLVCDFEIDGISLDAVLLFLELVESASSQKPVLYSGNTLKQLGGAKALKELADYRLWIAQYNNKGPTLPKGYSDWWLWQYSEKGKVAGIEGPVDLNAYNGTEDELKQNWVIRTSAAVSNDNSPTTHGTDSGANSIPQESASQEQPPIATSVEQTETKATNSGDTTTAVATTVKTEQPKGDLPDVPPTPVSKNGRLAKWLTGGGLSAIGLFAWNYIQTNPSAVAIAIICVTLLICVIIFRGAITDAIRMQTASDPDKKNVT